MSFKNYLVNMGIDAALGVYGIVFGFAGLGLIATGESPIAGVFFAVTAGLSLLYTRYRKQRKGITY